MKEGRRKEILWFLGPIFLALFFLLFDHQPWFGKIRGWLENPVLGIEKKMTSLDFQRHDRCSNCEIEKQALAVEQNQLVSCLEENRAMKKLLGAPLPANWQFLTARLISRLEPLKIDQGKKDGLEKGMVVVWENILVGRVERAGERFSLLQTPLTPNSKIPVVIKGPQQERVWARGILTSQAGELVLDNVLQKEEIQKGDLVATSGEAGWPTDLLIGRISEVLARPAEIYKKARVEVLFDYQELETVFVVIND